MKRLLFMCLVAVCAALAFPAAAQSYLQWYGSGSTSTAFYLVTESGVGTNLYNGTCKQADAILPSVDETIPYLEFSSLPTSHAHNKSLTATANTLLDYYYSLYYLSSIDEDGDYYKLVFTKATTSTNAKTNASKYVQTYSTKETTNRYYIYFTYNDANFEPRNINGKLCIVPQSDEMPGERFYIAKQITINGTGIVPTIVTIAKYKDGVEIPSTSLKYAFKNNEDSKPVAIKFALYNPSTNQYITTLNYSVSDFDETYLNYDEESGTLTLTPAIESPSEYQYADIEYAYTITTPEQYNPETKSFLKATTVTRKLCNRPRLTPGTWQTRNDATALSYIKLKCSDILANTYSKTTEVCILNGVQPYLFESYLSWTKDIFYSDEDGNTIEGTPHGFSAPSGKSFITVNGARTALANLSYLSTAEREADWKFGTQPLSCTLHTRTNLTYSYQNITYEECERGPDLTIEIVPYDLPEVKADAKFTAGKIHTAGEGIALTFNMSELNNTISPNWGTWTAKITPAFEMKDRVTLEQEYGWAHMNDDFADRWWEDSDDFDYNKEYVCTFDTEKKQLLIPEFNPSTSGMYHITLHASPMKEGYPYPFPFNDKTWDFDFAYHPDHTGLELATQIPYTDNEWEWTAVTHNGTWYGPSPEIPERKEAWKHLSVKPRGGYVDVWYKDISTGASKAAPQEAPARAASPADDGYKLMDGNYIDASNMNKVRLMVSKNGAVNPNVTDVNLARLDLSQTGVESIDATAEGDAEYYHLDGRRATGKLTPGLYIRSQGGATSKVVVRQ